MKIAIHLSRDEMTLHAQRQVQFDNGEINHPDPEAYRLAVALSLAAQKVRRGGVEIAADAGDEVIVELRDDRGRELYALIGEV